MSEPQLIPWDRAVLCMNCNRVSESGGACVGCGSTALLTLSAVYGANPQPETIEEPEVRIA